MNKDSSLKKYGISISAEPTSNNLNTNTTENWLCLSPPLFLGEGLTPILILQFIDEISIFSHFGKTTTLLVSLGTASQYA